MHGYIPSKEPEKIAWMQHFSEWVAAHGAGRRVPADMIAALGKAVVDADAARREHARLRDAVLDASAEKKKAMAEAVRLARAIAQMVQFAEHTTDEDRVAAGITVPKAVKTSPPAGYMKSLPPPEILIKYTGEDSFAIHWGPNPTNGRRNAKPPKTFGCELQIARGGIPSNDSGWRRLLLNTSSPIIMPIDESDPGPNAYRVCYLSRKFEKGAYSKPILFALGRS